MTVFTPLTTDSGDENAHDCAADDPGHNEDRSRNQPLWNRDEQSESYNILFIY